MKSEPSDYSIDDLSRDKREMWDGIRNYQVRNMIRDDMKAGDKALFYHSNTAEIGVVGEMKLVGKTYPDPTQFDKKNKHFDAKSDPSNPRWLCIDVAYKSKLPRIVTLNEMKGEKQLEGLRILQKGNRLSITPVAEKHYQHIVKMADK